MQVAVIHSAFEDTPRTVAFVEVGERTGNEALEYAYRWTNNVEGSWSLGVREFEDGEWVGGCYATYENLVEKVKECLEE